ncbi:MAG TPA: GNAT family N-acetyltransferase, partial [Nitrososphaeria archaeon]|nr:GNAT family N-acetyltransferase [Nitrososphaeria archaeon]
FKQLEWLQTEIWGRSEAIPYHVLIAFQRMGGAVFTALDANGRPIGMLCGYISVRGGETYYYLHLCGVVPDKRAEGIATALKMNLREYLLERGIKVARWLLDPLQVPEARLSLRKLGAVGRNYSSNFYGNMRDPYNRGLESDRLEVEWRLNSKRVLNRISGVDREPRITDLLEEGAESIITVVKEGVLEKILNYRLNFKSEKVLVEVPENIDYVKRASISTAVEWREITRKIFEKGLAQGYLVTDLIKERNERGTKYYYLLEKNVKLD